jgi:hypothetical protein
MTKEKGQESQWQKTGLISSLSRLQFHIPLAFSRPLKPMRER